MRDYLYLAFLIALLPLCFVRPFIGILAWTWIGYFNPHRFTWGFAQHLPSAMLVAVATILGFIFSRERKFPKFTREATLLFLLWLWFGVTTLHVYFAPEFFHHFPDSIGRLQAVSKILLMTFFAVIIINDRKRLRWWYLVTMGSFALLALKGFTFGLRTGGQFRVHGPESSMLTDNNAFALALNMCLPMFFCLAEIEERRWLRRMLRLSFVLGMIAVILTYSRGGLLGLIVVVLYLALRSKRKLLSLGGLAVLALAIGLLAPAKWIERMETIKTAKETDPSALSRINSWTFSVRLALDHPILGGGFETFTAPLYDRYSLREGPVILGPHSIYFQILAEHGFPGLLLFLAILSSCIWTCYKIRRRFARSPSARWPAVYAEMVTGSLLAYAVSGTFLGFAYFDLFYQMVGTTAILSSLAIRELARERTEQRGQPPESAPYLLKKWAD